MDSPGGPTTYSGVVEREPDVGTGFISPPLFPDALGAVRFSHPAEVFFRRFAKLRRMMPSLASVGHVVDPCKPLVGHRPTGLMLALEKLDNALEKLDNEGRFDPRQRNLKTRIL